MQDDQDLSKIMASVTQSGNMAGAQKDVNHALLFIKPQAIAPKSVGLVKQVLAANGCQVIAESELTSSEIDERGIIDRHYGALAKTVRETRHQTLANSVMPMLHAILTSGALAHRQ